MQPLDYCQPRKLTDSQALAVERFDRVLGVRNYSEATRRVYASALRHWMLFGGEPGHIDGHTLARYLATRRQNVSPAAVNIDIKALRSFYRLQIALDACAPGDLAKIPRQRKLPERVPRTLSAEELAEVFASIDLDTFLGVRDLTILRTLYESGLRSGELARLELGDILDDGVIFVRRGKGGRDRYVPITDGTHALLRAYITTRATTRPGKRAALWVRDDGIPLRNGRSIWEIVSKRVFAALHRRAGYRRIQRLATGRPWTGYYPHLLRAAYTSKLLSSGMHLRGIQESLGHADLSTTAHYLAVDIEHLRRAVSVHPRASRDTQACPATSPALESATDTARG